MEMINNGRKVLINRATFNKYYSMIQVAFYAQQDCEVRLQGGITEKDFSNVSRELLQIEQDMEQKKLFIDFTSPLVFTLMERMKNLDGVTADEYETLDL